MGGEAQPSFLSVALPELIVSPMRQIPAAHLLLELPEVTPQLEVLQEQRLRDEE